MVALYRFFNVAVVTGKTLKYDSNSKKVGKICKKKQKQRITYAFILTLRGF